MVNAKTEELFGYAREELLDQPLEILLPERYRDTHTTERNGFFNAPRTRPMGIGFDLVGRRKDGTEIPVEVALSFISERGARVALGLVTDISERKRLDEQLRYTQKLETLGVLAGGIAHDFNNLLTGIMGNSSLAREVLTPSSPAHSYINRVVDASQRAADLTRQLLAYAGKGRFVISAVNLSDLVREISKLIQASIPKNVLLRLALKDDLPSVQADASQIQQLVMNLIINAAEAIGKESGTVLVATGVQEVDEHYIETVFPNTRIALGQHVFLEVNDTGQGMNEVTVARIFEPFFTTKFTGRGLGLAAVSGIVRTHKGAVKVYSAPGRGSTFKVLLPVIEAGAAVEDSQVTAGDLSGTGVVLVVDDDAVVRQTAKAALQLYGYSVLLAADGQAALDIVRQMADQIDVVLLDVSMPGLSGEETYRQMRAIRPGIRTVLSSGFNEVEAVQSFSGKGLAGFIQKPYTAQQLAERMKSVLA